MAVLLTALAVTPRTAPQGLRTRTMAVDDTTDSTRTERTAERVLGRPLARREGRDKVTGAARYAAEHTAPGCAYGWPVPATVAARPRHRHRRQRRPGAARRARRLTHENAPRLGDADDPTLPCSRRPGCRTAAGTWRWPSAETPGGGAGRARSCTRRATTRSRTTCSSPPTTRRSTRPRWPTAASPAARERATSDARVRRRARHRRRHLHAWARCTTTRWSRTPPPRAGRTGN